MSQLEKILAHPKTIKTAGSYINRPNGPLLIIGASGSGKAELARAIAAELLGLDSAGKLDSYPYFHMVEKPRDKQDIPIEAIRAIGRQIRLKTPGKGGIRRVVLIVDAQHMSTQAQNALLKILEEPDDTTTFLLTAESRQALLPTIVSRAQRIVSHPVDFEQALKHFSVRFDEAMIKSAWNLSRGNSALLAALLSQGSEHSLKNAIVEAKSFFMKDRYQRLLALEKLSKSKEDFELFLEALERILSVLHRQSIVNGKKSQSKKLANDRQLVLSCRQALGINANARLIGLNLAIRLNS
ncbi:MAG TPA: AAA family ATPase [Candidatus Saccharimonadales bacterium]|nr:AAA family ATPase [Candidatus Saccharimonadales bacterium]